MADWPMIEGQRFAAAGDNAADSGGATVTSGETPHTKGNYAQIIAATAFDAQGILVHFDNQVALGWLLDIAVGAQGSEQVIAPNLLLNQGRSLPLVSYYFPIPIPAGTRIAARGQAASTEAQITDVTLQLLAQGFLPSQPLSRVTAYGAVEANTGGTQVDPGGSANTKNAYSQLVASSNRLSALIIAIGGQINSARADAHWLVDIAVGAAAAEQVVIPNLSLQADSVTDLVGPSVIGPLPCNIPAGSRIAARAQCDITDAEDRLFGIVVYGID